MDRASVKLNAIASRCEKEQLYFSRKFFNVRTGAKFLVNWHHVLIARAIEKVIQGVTKNLVITVAPGSSKTEIVVINFIARGLAVNPMSRFLHLSYSDDLAMLNSATARDIIVSDEYQELWPLKIAQDTKAKKRWNVIVDGHKGGGVYATSLNGQVTGFRAGHMAPGFQGAIIIDDPLKPEDAFSKTKLEQANRRLLTTVKSRRANPDTPIVVIMQRISDGDPVAFIKQGGLQGEWTYLTIPALIDDDYVAKLPEDIQALVNSDVRDDKGRFSYWQYKEPIKDLVAMESGQGKDQAGNQISRQVFAAQYQQDPVAAGGNLFKGKDFILYKKGVHPKILYRKMFVDSAQKIKERNDYTVMAVWGRGVDKKIYLLDLLRGKWEAPDLRKQAIAFWLKHMAITVDVAGSLREMKVEDKSSGTGLIQELKLRGGIPVKGIERNKDKYTRAMDTLPYVEAGLVCIPEDAPFTSEFLQEHEAFRADMAHSHDDQVDTTMDAVQDMLSTENKMAVWERLNE